MRYAMFEEHNDLGTPSSLNLIGEGCHYKEGDLKRRMGQLCWVDIVVDTSVKGHRERHLYYICDVVS